MLDNPTGYRAFGYQSGRVDLNHRPPGPEPGALTGLRYAPMLHGNCARNLEADPSEGKPSRPCGPGGAPVFPWTRSMTSDVVVRTRYSPRTAMCAVGAALLLQSGWACRRAATATAPRPPEVSVLTVAPETVSARYEFAGQAVASRHGEVGGAGAGVLVARPYAEGTDVPKRALLFQIDSTTYDAAYRSALAQLADATARSANAERNWSRLKALLGARAVAQKDVDDAQTAFDQARAAVQAAQAAVDGAKKVHGDPF